MKHTYRAAELAKAFYNSFAAKSNKHFWHFICVTRWLRVGKRTGRRWVGVGVGVRKLAWNNEKRRREKAAGSTFNTNYRSTHIPEAKAQQNHGQDTQAINATRRQPGARGSCSKMSKGITAYFRLFKAKEACPRLCPRTQAILVIYHLVLLKHSFALALAA